MSDHPIIMHGRSVQGILAGRKVQTRRPTALRSLRTVAPGDALWVREAWAAAARWDIDRPSDIDPNDAGLFYRADDPVVVDDYWDGCGRWRPSIHMPRWASRLTLRVTGVRVERLQAITCADVLREGLVVDAAGFGDPPVICEWPCSRHGLSLPARMRPQFMAAWRDAWDGIYSGRGWGWEANPEVRVIDFEVAP